MEAQNTFSCSFLLIIPTGVALQSHLALSARCSCGDWNPIYHLINFRVSIIRFLDMQYRAAKTRWCTTSGGICRFKSLIQSMQISSGSTNLTVCHPSCALMTFQFSRKML